MPAATLPKVSTRAKWDTSKHLTRPLTRGKFGQVAQVAKVATRAYALQKSLDNHRGLKADDWRREEAREACGFRLSEAQNQHFEKLMLHFAILANDTALALEYAQRDDDQGRAKRTALAVIMGHLKRLPIAEGADPEAARRAYAETICKARFKVGLDLASAEQLQAVAMTCKARMQALSKAAKLERAKERGHSCPPSQDREAANPEPIYIACEWACPNCGQIETSELDRDQHECPNLGD